MFIALESLWKDDEGLSTVEYALLLFLIVVAGITAWQQLDKLATNKPAEPEPPPA